MAEILKFLSILTDEDLLTTRRIPRPLSVYSQNDIQRKHVKSSLNFLEKLYIEFVDKTLSQFPKEAKLGGRPSLADKIRAFLAIKFGKLPSATVAPSLDLVQGLPIWAQVFYMIRCGDAPGSLEFVKSNSNLFYRLDNQFMMYLEKYIASLGLRSSTASGLPKDILAMIQQEYQAMRLNEHRHDPYKMVLYQWLSKSTVSSNTSNTDGSASINEDCYSHPLVIATIEDWIWYQTVLLPHPNYNLDLGIVGLNKFQQNILDLGPQYFLQEEQNPFIYVKILLLSGLYEPAIQFLHDFKEDNDDDAEEEHSKKTSFALEALHLTIILSYGHLLKTNELPLVQYVKEYMTNLCTELPHTAFYYILAVLLTTSTSYSTSAENSSSIFNTTSLELLRVLKDWTLQTTEVSLAFGTMDPCGIYQVPADYVSLRFC